MRLFTFITIIGAVVHSPCMSYRRFSSVSIYDPPRVAEYFSKVMEYPENNVRKEFKSWTKNQREEACLHALTDSVSFLIQNNEPSNKVPEWQSNDKADIFAKIVDSFRVIDDEENKVASSVNVDIEQKIVSNVPAHYCIRANPNIGDIVIVSGHHHNILFLLIRQPNKTNFQIIAIVEPTPSFKYHDFGQKYAQLSYIVGLSPKEQSSEESGLNLTEEDPEHGISIIDSNESYEDTLLLDVPVKICDLDEFQKYRICATVYTASMQFRNEMYTEEEYLKSPHECIRKGKIIIEIKDRSKIIEVDLLPCTVHKYSSKPKRIFVAVDIHKVDSAFVLEAMPFYKNWKSEENGDDEKVMGYSLVLHFNDVSAMKILDDGDVDEEDITIESE